MNSDFSLVRCEGILESDDKFEWENQELKL